MYTKANPLSRLGISKLGNTVTFHIYLTLCFCLTYSFICLYGTIPISQLSFVNQVISLLSGLFSSFKRQPEFERI